MAHSHNYRELDSATGDYFLHRGTRFPLAMDEFQVFDALADHWVGKGVIKPIVGPLTNLPPRGDRRLELIQKARKDLEIIQQQSTSTTVEQACCLNELAQLLIADEQIGAAKQAASQAIHLLHGKNQKYLICNSHLLFGSACCFTGERAEAAHHLEEAFKIAAAGHWDNQLCWIHLLMAWLFLCQQDFKSARTRVEKAEFHAAKFPYCLERVMRLQESISREEKEFQEANSKNSHAYGTLEKLMESYP